MMNPSIECLPKDKETILTVARWLCDEWGAQTKKLSPEAFVPGLMERTGCEGIPFTLLARRGISITPDWMPT